MVGALVALIGAIPIIAFAAAALGALAVTVPPREVRVAAHEVAQRLVGVHAVAPAADGFGGVVVESGGCGHRWRSDLNVGEGGGRGNARLGAGAK